MKFSLLYRDIKERMFERLFVFAERVFELPENECKNLMIQLKKRGYIKSENKYGWEIR